MSRAAVRKAKELHEQWLRGLTARPMEHAPRAEENVDGQDYGDAPTAWVCNRKKSYPEHIARIVAAKMNADNQTPQARAGFFGVVVNPYQCRRCGRWHIGR